MRLEELEFSASYADLGAEYATPVMAEAAAESRLAAFSPEAAALLDLDADQASRLEFTELIAGARLLRGMRPVASVYAGHQFGHPVPRLGDGRALILGDRSGWELQLKGSGRTPYSRMGDGRAVLRSCVREYLCSEAMHGLRIPTTRALAIAVSPESVRREEVEPRAVLARMAPSHVRFGTFEYFWFRHHAEPGILRDRIGKLADFVIDGFFSHLQGPGRYAAWLREVCERTGRLMAQWQGVGFNHGVMNTDNFSVLGLTIDYGPFGFLEEFDPGYICNHSDTEGRYAFGEQPRIGLWNLNVLGNAVSCLMTEDEVREALHAYEPAFQTEISRLLRAKLGLREDSSGDQALFGELFRQLHATRVDYTGFFRSLGQPSSLNESEWGSWLMDYRARLESEGQPWVSQERRVVMDAVNPKYILRNYQAQAAIDRAASGDFSEIQNLRQILARPYDDQPEHSSYAGPSPDWGRNLEISCSS